MRTVNIYEAKTHLSRLVESVEQGEEIIIARSGRPVAKLTQLDQAAQKPRPLGLLKGKIIVPDDFDLPMPDIEALFEEGDQA